MSKQIILAVDDVPANLDVLKSVLSEDYKLKVALNGEVAIKAARAEPQPDLILLDVMMPEMDGYETCRRLKADLRTRDIPVVFVTAMNEDMDEVKGFEMGAVDYVTKPITPLILRSRIRSHLALFNNRKEMWRQVQEQTRELKETRTEVIRQLGRAAEFKDNETGFHVIRMSLYCKEIALEYGLSESQADLLQNVAPMHDIGKLGVPDNVLQKPGKLNPEEWAIIQKHPEFGASILGNAGVSELAREARLVALTHHEHWDGKGYPRQLVGEDIPISGRIAALADVYDALVSVRPYKDAWPIDDAVAYIRQKSGSQFDPDVVRAFERALPKIREIGEIYAENVPSVAKPA